MHLSASIVSQAGDTSSPSKPDLVIVREVLQPLVVFGYSVKGKLGPKRAQAFQYSSVFQQSIMLTLAIYSCHHNPNESEANDHKDEFSE
jgi:hypothetical protein